MFNELSLCEKCIDVLGKLSLLMTAKGEVFKARAYQKAQESLLSFSFSQDLCSLEQLKGIPTFGKSILEKLHVYIQTGTLPELEREKNNPVAIFTEIYGVGPKKAQELVDNGMTTITQLRKNADKYLNNIQKIGLHYYEDILKRIPRSEIDEYNNIFNKIFNIIFQKTKGLSLDSNATFEIVGSYRRGAQDSGDIDVIITGKNNILYKEFINYLVKANIIVEILSRGEHKCLVIAKIPGTSSICRRVDFLFTSLEEYPFALLYFTGSKFFNTVMRNYVLSLGLTMNEYGLYTLVDNGKTKGDKVKDIFHSEKDIFDYLHLEYKDPIERKDGRAVVLIKKMEKMEKKYILEELLHSFKKLGISFLQTLSEDHFVFILKETNKAYYNNNPLLTDYQYDIIHETMKGLFPQNKEVLDIGAPVEKNKVILPYRMASMDKIKPKTNELENWCKKFPGPYVISCKLDGVSGLYTTEGKCPKLYTRGDGKIGQDISHLIPHLRLPKGKNLVIRGEFVMRKKIFSEKYKSTFSNARNLVSGIINQKSIDDKIKDIDFVAYEAINTSLKPSEQLVFLNSLNMEYGWENVLINLHLVTYKKMNILSNDILSNLLIDWRSNCEYDIDGIIVTEDQYHSREDGNPSYAFAFKMVLSDQIAEAKVVDVLWTASKDGYLKPRVQIEPIQLGGVTIEYATGFNADFIVKNKIGVGAVVEIIRSGDVIPHIQKVCVQAMESKMPTIGYYWNESGVDIILENKDTDQMVREKNIVGFFKGIGVDGLSNGNVARIMDAGYNTIPQIINMKMEDFLKVEGFQLKMATKIYEGIKEKLNSASLITIMSSSNIFGRGFSDKKLELIMENYPDIVFSLESDVIKINKIASIHGMSMKTGEMFVKNIKSFQTFLQEINLGPNNNTMVASMNKNNNMNIDHILYGKSIVMTGFRDSDVIDFIKKVGGKLTTSVSKNTFLIIIKSDGEENNKVQDAIQLNIPILTGHAFKKKYMHVG